jgi:hypothetical protein
MAMLNELLLAVTWHVEKFAAEAVSFDSAPSDVVNRYVIGIFLVYTLNLLAMYTHTPE